MKSKRDICKTFSLIQGPAWVTEQELHQNFVNPIHPALLEIINDSSDEKDAFKFLKKISAEEEVTYGLDKVPLEWVKYILSIQKKMPEHILKFTQTTSQQLTVSSQNSEHPFSTTLWLYAQILNYLTEEYHTNPARNSQRTNLRGKQFQKVVEWRSENGIGVSGGYNPKFAGMEYHKYMKKRYFPNSKEDGYVIGNMDTFIMSHGPKSLKFAISPTGDILARTEFRLQDSTENTLAAQSNIDAMFLNFANSGYAKMPVWIYEKSTPEV